jgi:uncharacterized protein YndB with AHSA1/START domain
LVLHIAISGRVAVTRNRCGNEPAVASGPHAGNLVEEAHRISPDLRNLEHDIWRDVTVRERRQVPVVDESISVAAPAHDVWRAIALAEVRADWWEYLDLDVTAGGRFVERWTDGSGRERVTAGVVTELAADRLLVLRWADDDDWPTVTRVEIRLAQVGDTTSVRLLHTGWEKLPDKHGHGRGASRRLAAAFGEPSPLRRGGTK